MITLGVFFSGVYKNPAEMPVDIKQAFVYVCGDRYIKLDPLFWEGDTFLVVNAMCYMSLYYELEEYPDAVYVVVDSSAAEMHLDTLRQAFRRISFTVEKIDEANSVVCLSNLLGEWKTYVYRALLLVRLLSPQFVRLCRSMPLYECRLEDSTLFIQAKAYPETLEDRLLGAAMASELLSTDDFPGKSSEVYNWIFTTPQDFKTLMPAALPLEAVQAAVYSLVIQRVMPLLRDEYIITPDMWEGMIEEGFTSDIELQDSVNDVLKSTITRVVYQAHDGTEMRFVLQEGGWKYE